MNDIHAKKTARPFTLTVHEVRRQITPTSAVTLCGRTVEFGPAQIAVCDTARRAGTYTKVSCPLCEAARFIDSLHIKGTWIQPAFIGGDAW